MVILLVVPGVAQPQAVSEWRLESGLPAAVVETPGGDIQRIVALVPPGKVPPDRVLGFPASSSPRREGIYWTLELPAVLAGEGLQEVARLLMETGASSVVTLGPTPARMLTLGLESLEKVPVSLPRRRPCVIADGAVEVRRGGPEAVEIALAAFPPEDVRFPLLPALSTWLRLRLAGGVPGVEVLNLVEDGCTRLLIRAPAPRDHPRETLETLRELLRMLPSRPATAEEVAEVDAISRREAGRWTMDGKEFAVQMAQRLAFGGNTAGMLYPPFVDGKSLAALAEQLVAGRQGSAVMIEQERRPRWEPPSRLENGILVSVRWIPGEVATMGIAFGAVEPEATLALGREAALALSQAGWPAEVLNLNGLPAISVAMPHEDVVAVLETISEFLVADDPKPRVSEWSEVFATLGLSPLPSPAALSIALLVPPAADQAMEAVAIFFSSLRKPGVEIAGIPASSGLNWLPEPGGPRMLAAVDLPGAVNGHLAGEVLARRLAAEPGVQVRWLQPPGRLVLAVIATGEEDVPGLDRRMGQLWQRARRAASEEEVAAARRRLTSLFFGDMARSTARAAADALVADLPRPEDIAAADTREVSAVLSGLSRWEGIERFAFGPGPE